jgi:DNA-binding transcriptional ArsR family regulator
MKRHTVTYPLHAVDAERAIAVLGALAEKVRLELVILLTQRERSVGDMVRETGLPQSTVSRHLAQLRHHQLVQTRREGTTVLYRLRNAHLAHLAVEVLAFAEHERLSLPDHEEDWSSVVRAHIHPRKVGI